MTVYKMTDVVGTSTTSVSDAIRGAVERASQTLDDLQWFEVKEIRGRITPDNEPEYQVRLEIGFTLHAPANQERLTKKGPTKQTRSQIAQVAAKGGEKRRSDLARSFEQQGSRKRRA